MKNQSVLSARGFGGVILCGLVSFGLAAQAWAQSATFTTQAYPLIGNTHVAADFNGDGKPDLAGSGAMAASVMLNNGNGTFGPKTDFPVVTYTQDVAAGDFNGDGKIDLAVTIQSPQISLAILLGTGTGSFGAPTYYPNAAGFDSPQVLAADINKDAKLDVVIMHNIDCFTAPCRPGRIVTLMLGNGDGTFLEPVPWYKYEFITGRAPGRSRWVISPATGNSTSSPPARLSTSSAATATASSTW